MATRCGLGKVDIRAVPLWIDNSTGKCRAPCEDGGECGSFLKDHPETVNMNTKGNSAHLKFIYPFQSTLHIIINSIYSCSQ